MGIYNSKPNVETPGGVVAKNTKLQKKSKKVLTKHERFDIIVERLREGEESETSESGREAHLEN